MPYIVTTKRPNPGDCGDPDCESCNQDVQPIVSRDAVAMLEEVRDTLFDVLRNLYPDGVRETGATEAALHANSLRASGGTVGPLPDGTVIEVERVTWRELQHAALSAQPLDATRPDAQAEIIDAYNAKQAATA